MRWIIGFFLVLAAAALGSALLDYFGGTVLISWRDGTERQMSLAVALCGMAALVAVLLAASHGFSWLFSLPRRLKRRRALDRRNRGLGALTQGMLAVAAGDAKAATRHARDADNLLNEPALTLLLGAQAAQLAGDPRAAEERFTEMLANKETEFLGLRGLFVQASRRGDSSVALAYLRKAAEQRPGTPWVINALFDLHVADGRWAEAQEALDSAEKAKLLGSDVVRRRRAVLLAAEAAAMLTQDRMRSLTLAEEAVRLSPALTAAATLAARLLGEEGRSWRAQAIIENAWAQAPHPELAAAYARLKPDESPREQASRLMGLSERNSGHVESRLLTAQQWIALKDWSQARAALADLPERTPSARVAALMAEIAQGLGHAGEARFWHDRAVHAPREPQWVCDNCHNQAAVWAPLCPSCAAFDTLSWRMRTEMLLAGPELGGLTVPVATAPANRLPVAVPTAPPPPPAPRTAAPDSAARSVAEWLHGGRAASRGAPAGTAGNGGGAPHPIASAPAPKPAEEGPVIFVSPRPPDDPGPEATLEGEPAQEARGPALHGHAGGQRR
jgi:HemY protein